MSHAKLKSLLRLSSKQNIVLRYPDCFVKFLLLLLLLGMKLYMTLLAG